MRVVTLLPPATNVTRRLTPPRACRCGGVNPRFPKEPPQISEGVRCRCRPGAGCGKRLFPAKGRCGSGAGGYGDMGREEIRRLWATVWVLTAILPEEGPGAGFAEFCKGRVPPRVCGCGNACFVRILTKRSRRSTLPVLTAKPHSIRPGRTRPEEKTYHRGEGEGEPGLRAGRCFALSEF
jgi:hypothetical protein